MVFMIKICFVQFLPALLLPISLVKTILCSDHFACGSTQSHDNKDWLLSVLTRSQPQSKDAQMSDYSHQKVQEKD